MRPRCLSCCFSKERWKVLQTMTDAPLIYTWDGCAMVPLEHLKARADRQFVVGQQYRLLIDEERSMRSHSFYFARLAELFGNLPHELATRFPDVEDLRAWALIMTSWSETKVQSFSSPAEAVHSAAILAKYIPRAVIVVKDRDVLIATARSQSKMAMNKSDFEKSKADVLAYVENMIGIGPGETQQSA